MQVTGFTTTGPAAAAAVSFAPEALTYAQIGGSALNLTESMSKTAFGKLTADIAKNGLQDKVINYVEIGGENYVVNGNNRVMAARQLGITDQLTFQKVTLPSCSVLNPPPFAGNVISA